MTLAYLGYAMIAVLMVLIVTKKMSPFAALMSVPLVFGAIACVINGVSIMELTTYCTDSMKGMASNFCLMFFAIVYFALMVETGMFDPLVSFIVRFVKGDPLKVLVGVAVMAAIVALDGDGTTTYLIICTAMIPVFERLKMNKLYLAGISLSQVSVMNLLPWGGPTARILVVCGIEPGRMAQMLMPGMILAILYNIGVAYYLGLKERKRLGIADISAMEVAAAEDESGLKRPKLVVFNFALTILSMVALIAGWVPSMLTFAIATTIALIVNYPNLKTQNELVQKCGAETIPVISLILAAGILMGVLDGCGMSDAMALHLSNLVPESLSSFFSIISSIISCFGTFFLSNDGYYYGVLPILAEAGYACGFNNETMAYAAAMGQCFHLISPLVGSFYVISKLTDQGITDIQKFNLKWGPGMFLAFAVAGVLTGVYPW
ncbi:MAG: citrate transporter [Lachnospiraceae bacterium]|nr:citrate transporter [Lachnospiraceae bacterium]